MRLHHIVQALTAVSIITTSVLMWQDAASLNAFWAQGVSVLMIGMLILSTLAERKRDAAQPSGDQES